MDAFRTAYVYIRGIFAGTLCETDEGYSFSYDEQYLSRISKIKWVTHSRAVYFS